MVNRIQIISGNIMLLWGWQRYALTILCGALSAFALAPFHLFPILFFTLPVFIWLLDGAATDPASGLFSKLIPFFKTGWCFSFGFHVAGMWWVGNALLVEAEAFAWLLPAAILVLPAGLAMFTGVCIALARLFWKEHWSRIFLFAAAYGLSEYLRGVLFTGLPWNLLGYAAMPTPLAMQSAALIGTYGVTLVSIPVFAALACCSEVPNARGGRFIIFGLALCLTAGHLAYGYDRLHRNSTEFVPDVTLRVVQPAIAQKDKWAPEKEAEIFRKYLDLSTSVEDGVALTDVTHLIWPESAFPFVLTERRDALASIAAMLPEGTELITGAARVEASVISGNEPFVFNSIYTIDSQGIVTGAADKVHLVPFGEFLPFQSTLESIGLRQLAGGRGGFEPGSARKVLSSSSAPDFLPLICYEIVFPSQILTHGDRPDWIVNLTNDAWFGNTPGPRQHLHQAIIRGVEEGIPVVRAANTGISSVTDAFGRTIRSLDYGETGHIDSPLPTIGPSTLYNRFGNLIFLLMIAIFCVPSIFARKT